VNADVAKPQDSSGNRRDLIESPRFRTTPKVASDALSVMGGGLFEAVCGAPRSTATPKTVAKVVRRFRAEGVAGLQTARPSPLIAKPKLPACPYAPGSTGFGACTSATTGEESLAA